MCREVVAAVATAHQAQVVPHSRVVDKNWEGYLGSERSHPQVRVHSIGFQCWEDKNPSLLVVKTSGGWGGGRNCWIFRKLHLKGLHGLKMYMNPPTLGVNTRARAGRVPVAYGQWMK